VQRHGGLAVTGLSQHQHGASGRQVHHRELRGIEVHVDQRGRVAPCRGAANLEDVSRQTGLAPPYAVAALGEHSVGRDDVDQVTVLKADDVALDQRAVDATRRQPLTFAAAEERHGIRRLGKVGNQQPVAHRARAP
jgi:hypothetical protein